MSEKLVSQETRLQQVEDFIDSLKGFIMTILGWFGAICLATCMGLAFILNLYLTPINIQLKALTDEMKDQRIEAKELREKSTQRYTDHSKRLGKVEVEVTHLKERLDRR